MRNRFLTVVIASVLACIAAGDIPTLSGAAQTANQQAENREFRLSFGWGSAWEPVDVSSAYGEFRVELESNNARVELRAAPSFGGDEDVCIESSVDAIGFDPAVIEIDDVGDDGVLPFEDGTSLSLEYTVQMEDTDPEQVRMDVWCFTLQPGYSTVFVELRAFASRYQAALRDAEELTFEQTGTPRSAEFAYASTQQDLTSFWTQQFEAWEEAPYVPPSYVMFSDRRDTLCGSIESVSGWFYCWYDVVVYADGPISEEYEAKYGVGINIFLTAHETGHHVARHLIRDYCDPLQCVTAISSLQFELLADCFAGAWMGSARQRDVLAVSDIDGAMAAIADSFGDPTHGAGTDRLWWLLQGYHLGPGACLVEAAT